MRRSHASLPALASGQKQADGPSERALLHLYEGLAAARREALCVNVLALR